MFDDRIGDMQKMLARMGPAGRQKYAADNANDPIAVSMALFVNNIAKELTEGKAADPTVQAPVVQQAIQAMNQPRMPPSMPQAMPQRMPPQGMPQRMPPPQGQTRMAADGGYMDSRLPEDMGIGALPERSLSGMADGGIVGFAGGGNLKGAKLPSFNDALDAEGVRDPRQRAFLKALYGQESGSGADTTTSNQGAVGHMQIKPSTFAQVASKGMNINDPFDNMRAGIRYGMQGYQAANGDPVLAGAYYYGGPGGMQALAQGQVRTDPKNPKAPNTLEYGKSIAQRMTALLPIGTAQAQTAPSAAAPVAAPATTARTATTADLQALRKSSNLGDKVDTAGQVLRSLGQNAFARVAGGLSGLAGSLPFVPGPEGQGADYAKRVQEYMSYHPKAITEDSKKILGVLGAPLEYANKYVGVPAGDYLAEQGLPVAASIARALPEAAFAAVPLALRGARATGGAKPAAVEPAAAAPEAAVAAEAPVAAAPVAPPVRTVPTPAQRAAADTAQPVPQGLARVNQAAQLRKEAAAQAAQEAAAAKGPQLPPLVGPPKPAATGIATLAPEAAALRTAAEARAKARAAERAAPAAAAAEEGAGAGAAAPRTGLAALPEAAGAAVAEVPAVSRMAAARAAIGEGRGRAALLPAIAAAGAGTGSGASSSENATFFDRTSGDDTRGFPTFPAPAALTPEVKKEAVAEATKTIMAGPEPDRLKGLGYEDLLMFGLQLMAGKSQYALQNVGEAGVAALTANQARRLAEKKTTMEERKIASDEQKESAMAKYYEKHGNYLDSEAARKAEEDKPLAQFRKELATQFLKLEANQMLSLDPVKMAAAKRQARAELLASYPELMGTMGGAPSAGRVIDFSSIQ